MAVWEFPLSEVEISSGNFQKFPVGNFNSTQYAMRGDFQTLAFVPSSSSWVLFANKILQIGRMHVVGPVRDLAGMVPGFHC